jgi:hypothetical protein
LIQQHKTMRAEIDALKAEQASIRIRPASEHDGKTPAQWFFYRTAADGTVVREAFQGYGLQLDSPLLYWAPLPDLIDPPHINALPTIGERTRKKRSELCQIRLTLKP